MKNLFLKWYRLPNKDRILLLKTLLILVSIRLGLLLMRLTDIRRFMRWTDRIPSINRDHSNQDLEKAI
jgi:hypothetical protein